MLNHSVFVTVSVGDTSTSQELLLKDDKKILVRTAELYHYDNDIKFTARSWVHTIRRGACYSRAKSAKAEIADPKLALTDDVSSWKVGKYRKQRKKRHSD